MKLKLVLAAALVAFAGAASAIEVGVNGSYDYGSTPERAGTGITIGQKYGAVGVTVGFDNYTKSIHQNKYSVVGSYDVAKVGQATVAVKGGVAYLDNASGTSDGFAALVGAGASYPLTKELAATVDYRYQVGQSRVDQFNGNQVAVGLKYSF